MKFNSTRLAVMKLFLLSIPCISSIFLNKQYNTFFSVIQKVTFLKHQGHQYFLCHCYINLQIRLKLLRLSLPVHPFHFPVSFQFASEWATILGLIRGSLVVHSVIVKRRAHSTLRDGWVSVQLTSLLSLSSPPSHSKHVAHCQPASVSSMPYTFLSTCNLWPCAVDDVKVNLNCSAH